MRATVKHFKARRQLVCAVLTLGLMCLQSSAARGRVVTAHHAQPVTELTKRHLRLALYRPEITAPFAKSLSRGRIPRDQRVAVLGDSIVADGFLVHYLRRELGEHWSVENFGLNCDTPGQMLRRIRRQNQPRDPMVIDPRRFGVVIVLGGVNGIYPDIDAGNGARTQLAALFRRIKTLGGSVRHPKVVGLTMLPWGDWHGWSKRQDLHTQMLNRWLVGVETDGETAVRSVAPPELDIAVDLYSELVDPSSLNTVDRKGTIRPRLSRRYTDDGLHLNQAGARHVAELLGKALTRHERSTNHPRQVEAVSVNDPHPWAAP